MDHSFILSCESTVDMPYSYVSGRDISVLFYKYAVDGKEFDDDMGRDPEALPRFYEFLNNGYLPTTSQVNKFRYLEYFEDLLQKGDVLHIAFGSGVTPSVNNAFAAAEELKEKYPDRELIVIDSHCASSGYGLIVDEAADLRDKGLSMDEIASWVNDNNINVQHQLFSTDLKFFKRSGRVSGATAAIGTVLGICPIMRLNNKGSIIAYSKARGKAATIEETVWEMEALAQNGTDYDGKCFISHSNCIELAESVKSLIESKFKNLKGKIKIFDIGTIIAAHCGPGTVALFFNGSPRVPDPKKTPKK